MELIKAMHIFITITVSFIVLTILIFCLVKSLTRFLAKQAVNIRKITQYQLLTAIKAYDPKMADIIYKYLKEEWRSLDVDQNQ